MENTPVDEGGSAAGPARRDRDAARPAPGPDAARGAAWKNPRLTFRRLSGLDRSGPPPPQTAAGQPLNPWTIPNAIGYLRFALLPVFLVVALGDDDGVNTTAAIVFAIIGWSDYADGIAARVTGQYSRLGALMDPLIDRLLVVSGVVVCWHFELLPRWALAVLAAREIGMLALTRWGLSRGLELKINWPGRIGVWPVMAAPFFAMIDLHTVALICLYVGMVFTLWATVLYVIDARRQLTLKRK